MTRPPRPEQQLNARTDALLRRLVRRDAATALRKVLARSRPEDIAAAMEHLTWSEQRHLYGLIDDRDFAAEVLANLSDESSREVTSEMTEEAVVDLLDRMEPDDATDVVEILPADVRLRVLDQLDADEEHTNVRQLLEWPSDSAGGLMSPHVFKMPMHATCGDAIVALQDEHREIETIYYVYVVDRDERLVGVSSLRALLTAMPGSPLSDVMTRRIISVGPSQDQEEVARFVARYDLLAIPVVSPDNRILGLVTVDDVVDVIREEAAEDMMLMAGVSDDQGSVLRQTWHRAGWLLAMIAGGILAAEIIGIYEDTLKKVAILAGFIPVIMGMGGAVGIQSATLAVRGLAIGRVQLGGPVAFIFQEARVGLLLGILYAVLLGIYGLVRFRDEPMIGGSVALSCFFAVSLASVMGAAIPVALDKAGVDPAIATGPFVTTAVDLTGILIYFNVARLLLGL